MFPCKEQQKQLGAADGDPFAKGSPAMLPAPPMVPRMGHMAAEPLLCQFGETGHYFGNLAGRPDFKVSHYRSPAPLDLDAARREAA